MDDDVTRILNCVNSCWPEIPFSHNDIRRPTGEKFRELLRQFLKSFIVGNNSCSIKVDFDIVNIVLSPLFYLLFSFYW